MTSLNCRQMTLSELPEVLVLDQACFGGLWSPESYQRELDSPNSNLLVLEAVRSPDSRSSIIGIGCLWAIVDEAHITLLGIAPAYRGRGLGQWLLLHLLQSAYTRGLTYATLEVRESNQLAQRIYHKYGFRVAGRRQRYYSDGENALILWRNALQEAIFTTTSQTWKELLVNKLTQQGWQLSEFSLSL